MSPRDQLRIEKAGLTENAWYPRVKHPVNIRFEQEGLRAGRWGNITWANQRPAPQPLTLICQTRDTTFSRGSALLWGHTSTTTLSEARPIRIERFQGSLYISQSELFYNWDPPMRGLPFKVWQSLSQWEGCLSPFTQSSAAWLLASNQMPGGGHWL